jgi:S-DNA-T family DNA segregation ATPase FtsK/SpoIIIE
MASIASAIALTGAALMLAFSITGAIFSLPFIGRALGAFLVGAYGVLAILIPVYLIWAAWILVDSRWRPDRIFVLAAAILPFMTLAIGIGFIQRFDYYARRFAALERAGRNGFSVFVILLAFVEGMIIRAFLPFLFPERYGAKKGSVKKTSVYGEAALPIPFTRGGGTAGTDRGESGTGPDAAVPAGEANTAEDTSLLPAEREANAVSVPVIINFPEQKPLASARALQELERNAMNAESEADGSGVYAGGAEDEAAEEREAWEEPEELEEAETAYESRAGYYRPAVPFPAKSVPESEDDLPGAEDGEAEESASYITPPGVPPGSGSSLFDTLEVIEDSDDEENSADSAPASAPRRREKTRRNKPAGRYHIPAEILTAYPDWQYWIIDQGTKDAALVLEKTLEEFNIQAEVTGIKKGPVITMFEILPAPGVKLSRIVNLQDNIALRLAASSVRIVAPIPGKHAVGIEVPNRKRNIVSFREIIEGELSAAKKADGKKPGIPVALGKDITGEAQTVDLTQTPHLLIAGSTGSGKSVCVNAIILSILYQLPPQECRLILIDPKIVELKLYNDIPHLLTPVITEPKRAFQALQYCIFEMERRYACLDSMGVRDIKSYNKRIRERSIAAEYMPYIVVIIDEFADLMATTGKELESTVARLAAMSRAVGIHLVLATQRPSIDVITGLIKANIPSRIAFMVASKMDSRIIIDQVGAEKLLGKGDMLYAGVVDPFPVRMQGAFVTEEEVEKVVEHVKTLGEPDYIDDEIFYDEDEEGEPSLFSDGEDPLYDKALEIVMQQGKASASYIQRRLKIGYNRAARIVEEMAARGVVGPAQGSRPRELLRGA